MNKEKYVHRDFALTQSAGSRWGIVSILIFLFILALVIFMIGQISTEEDPLNTVMVSWFGGLFPFLGLHQGYFGFKRFFQQLASLRAKATGKPRWQQDHSLQKNWCCLQQHEKAGF